MEVLTVFFRFHLFFFACQLVAIFIQSLFSTSKLLLKKVTIHTIYFVIISFCFPIAYSQESTSEKTADIVSSDVLHVSESELLTQAKSLRYNDLITSTKIANEVLRIAIVKNNHRVSAQAHYLLGELTQQSENIEQSKHHFLQASIIYKSINDKRNQILASLEYAELFFTEKRYNEAEKLLNDILPIAKEYGDDLPIAQTFISIGNNYYQQKRYNDAIKKYEEAQKYLSDKSESIQKRLGTTYHNIALL